MTRLRHRNRGLITDRGKDLYVLNSGQTGSYSIHTGSFFYWSKGLKVELHLHCPTRLKGVHRYNVTLLCQFLKPDRSKEFFGPPKRPDRLWGPPRLLSNGYRCPFSVVKRPVLEVKHSPPSSTEVKNRWSYTPIPLMPSRRGQGKLYFLPTHFRIVAF